MQMRNDVRVGRSMVTRLLPEWRVCRGFLFGGSANRDERLSVRRSKRTRGALGSVELVRGPRLTVAAIGSGSSRNSTALSLRRRCGLSSKESHSRVVCPSRFGAAESRLLSKINAGGSPALPTRGLAPSVASPKLVADDRVPRSRIARRGNR